MSESLKVGLLQSNLVWENPVQNRMDLEAKIRGIPEDTDLIVLPEMFTSGFTMQPQLVAESMQGETVGWMQKQAAKNKAAVMGSLVIEKSGCFYNRLLFVHPSGKIEHYNKRHTFTLAGEHEIYQPGTRKLIVDYKGWKICPLICYDLRFPVWARNTELYDVLIYVANWPKPRISAWDALLKARAIENMSYCIGVNRVGMDPNGHQYPGHTAVYDVLGDEIAGIPPDKEQLGTIVLEKEHIKYYREKLRFLEDRDTFRL